MFKRDTWKKVKPVVKNKFFITSFLFMLWILAFDQNNLIERRKLIRELNQLKREKQFYIERIDNDSRRLNELRTDNENLEKFAREEYLMKKENEDIFLIVEED